MIILNSRVIIDYIMEIEKLFSAFVILVFAFILSHFTKRTVDYVLVAFSHRISKKQILSKTKTLRLLLKSVSSGIIYFIAFLTILSQFGINIVPVLTGAGILGLGFSLGAQTLFKDVIAGFFIIVEDQFNVGDKVKIGAFKGEVEKISLRTTVLRDEKGNLIFIPNSEILSVVRLK